MPYIYPWPKGTTISQYFGQNPGGVNPSGGHTGMDAALDVGTPLRSPCDGVVVFEGTNDLVEKLGGRPPMTLEAFIEKHRAAFV